MFAFSGPLLRALSLVTGWLGLILALWVSEAGQVHAEGAGAFPTKAMLRLESNAHSAVINDVAVDADGYLFTVSDDKTLREWAPSGQLLATLRPPIGAADEGALYAVALSSKYLVVAGRTGIEWNRSGSLYVFDRKTLSMVGAVNGLPGIIGSLAFSPDGRYLAAGLLGSAGISVLDMQSAKLLTQIKSFSGAITGLMFGPEGTLYASATDGAVASFDMSGRVIAQRSLAPADQPHGLAVSPDGHSVAVGLRSASAVLVLRSTDFEEQKRLMPQSAGSSEGAFTTVAWLADGKRVAAAGLYKTSNGQRNAVIWDAQSGQHVMQAPLALDTITRLKPTSDGGIIYTTAEPSWGRLDAQGHSAVSITSTIADFRDIGDALVVSNDGRMVDFALARNGQERVRFSLADRRLLTQAGAGPGVGTGRFQNGLVSLLAVRNSAAPSINGAAIALESHEQSLSGAVIGKSARAVIGSNFYIRIVNAQGHSVAKTVVPAPAWGVAATEDGKLVIAALADGTIRWYDAATGVEKLALFVRRTPMQWIAWTPEGFFDHSEASPNQPSPIDLIGYHLNTTPRQNGKFIGARQFYGKFYRKDRVAQSLSETHKDSDEASNQGGDVQTVLEQGLPPIVRILEVCEEGPSGPTACKAAPALDTRALIAPAVSVKTANVILKTEVIDQGGGAGDVILRRDGAFQDSLRVVVTQAPKSRIENVWVSLAEGENAVRVAAVANNGVKSGNGDEAALTLVYTKAKAEGVASDDGRHLYVLAIGINQYQYISQLDNAAADARAIAGIMGQGASRLYTKLNVETLTDAQASREAISAAFKRIAAQVRPQDMLLVFLAGHGESIHGEYHFAPVDMGKNFKAEIAGIAAKSESEQKDLVDKIYLKDGLSQGNLIEMMSSIKASEAVLLIDTCYSGAVVNDNWVNVLAESSGRFVMAASTATQAALDGGQGEGSQAQHGLFTQKVLEALGGKADWDQDKVVDVSELAKYARRAVPEAAAAMGYSGPQAQEPTYYIGSKNLFGVRSL